MNELTKALVYGTLSLLFAAVIVHTHGIIHGDNLSFGLGIFAGVSALISSELFGVVYNELLKRKKVVS